MDHGLLKSAADLGCNALVSRRSQQPFGAFELWMDHVNGDARVPLTRGKLRPDARPHEDDAHALGAVASPDGAFLDDTRRPKLFNPYNNVEFLPLPSSSGATA